MKTNPTAQESGWRVSFWFAVSSPLIGVLLAFLAAAIFVDDRRSHEHNTNHLRLGDFTVRFRFGRTRSMPVATRQRLGKNQNF